MKDFKAQLNPLLPIARFTLGCLFIYYVLGILPSLPSFIEDFKLDDFRMYLRVIKGLFLAIIMIFGSIIPFIKTTKTYTIKSDSIEEFNFLTFKRKTIDKESIRGFSTSMIQYRTMKWDEIIIYLKDGSKIHLHELLYINFPKIKPALLDNDYNYFGYEFDENQIFRRKYKFNE